ncbi:hypothetical protein MFRU_013g01760 [Monilinia fructicola]|nr:hypothetical protein MFRU_013g01760 [Monilinia fructicola]
MRLISLLPLIMLPLALAAPVPDIDPLASASAALAILNSSLASSLSSAEVAYLNGLIADAAALQSGASKNKRQGVTEEVDSLPSQLGVLAGVVKKRQVAGLDPGTIVTSLEDGGLLNDLIQVLKERDENTKTQGDILNILGPLLDDLPLNDLPLNDLPLGSIL